jgi:hypothetical protein
MSFAMAPNPATMQFANLAADFGPVIPAHKLPREDWLKARAEKRYVAVFPESRDSRSPAIGLVAHEGVGPGVCRLVFFKPIPESVFQIVGLRNSLEALALIRA